MRISSWRYTTYAHIWSLIATSHANTYMDTKILGAGKALLHLHSLTILSYLPPQWRRWHHHCGYMTLYGTHSLGLTATHHGRIISLSPQTSPAPTPTPTPVASASAPDTTAPTQTPAPPNTLNHVPQNLPQLLRRAPQSLSLLLQTSSAIVLHQRQLS